MDVCNREELEKIVDGSIDIEGVSDYYFATGTVPAYRIKNEIVSPEAVAPCTDEVILDFIKHHIDVDVNLHSLSTSKGASDFAIKYKGRRLRCNLDRRWQGLDLTMRLLPSEIKTLAELGLPTYLYDLMELKQGFVLICGPTGSGKSTTLAALLNHVNKKCTRRKIVTIEDPIEYIIPEDRAIISQQEVTPENGFLACLRAAMRKGPNIISVGEIRDADTAVTAITAAETGHLVLSTMHTVSTEQTILRLTDMLPEHIRGNILSILAAVLRAVVVQRLVRARTGGKIHLAYEICMVDTAISNLIRMGKGKQINNSMLSSRGSVLFNTSIMNLVNKGIITFEEAKNYAYDAESL